MNENITYRTTAKGQAEIAAKPGLLKPGMKGLLAAVGGHASAEDLRVKFPRAGDIGVALAQLALDGFVEPVPEVTPKAMAKVDELEDFLSGRPKEPTIQQLQHAESTLSGARHLKAGYQISILNRPGKPIAPRGGGSKHVLLIIDSHEAEALAAARGLMQGGFDIRGAASRAEIAAALGKQPLPDLIIMDVDLQDAVGLDVLGKLHEHHEFKDTPIIVVTARAERDDIVAALAYGASGYLNKPVKPDILLRYARDALGLS
ncbi:MAG: response regulator [Burkholderiales bacterium]|nr:response regulator [Burkholderiales bacterium]